MKKKSITLSKNEVSQSINLKEIFKEKLGSSFNKKLSEIKSEFFDLAVETIQNRTANYKDIDGNKFKRYSKEYASFKGVSRNSVDMELDGDMVNSIRKKGAKELLKLEIKSGVETLKAYNHCVGDTLPKRNWFGLTQKEIENITKEILKSNRNQKEKVSSNKRIKNGDLILEQETEV